MGSRKFLDYQMMKEKFKEFLEFYGWKEDGITIVSGGAKGADTLAEKLADEFGYAKKIMKADWKNIYTRDAVVKEGQYGLYNVKAGLNRNLDIADDVGVVIAFWDGKSTGTRHMIKACRDRDRIVEVVRYEDDRRHQL